MDETQTSEEMRPKCDYSFKSFLELAKTLSDFFRLTSDVLDTKTCSKVKTSFKRSQIELELVLKRCQTAHRVARGSYNLGECEPIEKFSEQIDTPKNLSTSLVHATMITHRHVHKLSKKFRFSSLR